MNEIPHWIVVGFFFAIGFCAGNAVYAAVLSLLGQGGKK